MGREEERIQQQLAGLVGETFVMVAAPTPSYAGTVGARAVMDDLSSGAVYVRFETGLRESYPCERFVQYFQRAARPPVPAADPVAAAVAVDLAAVPTPAAGTPSDAIRLAAERAAR